MPPFTSLVNILQDRAETHADRAIFRFLEDGETEVGSLNYRELDLKAKAIAASLQAQQAQGKHALLVYPYPAGLDFIAAFMGCLYAGVVAVTDNPPYNLNGFKKLGDRIQSSDAQFLLSTQEFLGTLEQALTQPGGVPDWVKRLRSIATDQVAASQASEWKAQPIESDQTAFLQYTSGSTGIPKGVQINHRNIMHNVQVIQTCFEVTEDSRSLFWLPVYHDMGLIGGILAPLYCNCISFLMSPVSFIQKPSRWVQAISEHQITISGSANFAYDLLCHRVSETQLADLDLSAWSLAFTGAEPIRASTLETFNQKFKPCGFKPEAFYPCYGMAETTLLITGGQKSNAPKIDYVHGEALQRQQVEVGEQGSPKTRAIMGCGTTHSGDEVIIVEPESMKRLADLQVGEIWIRGAGVGQGYYGQAQETAKTFGAYPAGDDTGQPYLRTGDFGYLRDQELFITGRLKEMLILWGRNMYPQHLEQTAQASHPQLQENGGAAFALDLDGDERLIFVHEVKRQALRKLDIEGILRSICTAIALEHTATVYAIALIKPTTLPKTTSGKVQRKAAKELFQSPDFAPLFLWKADEETTISDLFEQAIAQQ